jgi:hypothetical protein
LLTVGSLGLFYTQDVTVKLLPFDNKTDLQVVVDCPKASVEDQPVLPLRWRGRGRRSSLPDGRDPGAVQFNGLVALSPRHPAG